MATGRLSVSGWPRHRDASIKRGLNGATPRLSRGPRSLLKRDVTALKCTSPLISSRRVTKRIRVFSPPAVVSSPASGRTRAPTTAVKRIGLFTFKVSRMGLGGTLALTSTSAGGLLVKIVNARISR